MIDSATPLDDLHARGVRLAVSGLLVNLGLAAVKIVTGVVGSSYALVADGIESITDGVGSVIVISGLRWAAKPPDENHPYGHGKAESMAALGVAVMLLAAAVIIAIESIAEIHRPHLVPAWFTLPVLAGVIGVKVLLSRRLMDLGTAAGSSSLRGDGYHHLSDAITSAAAFIGISLALIGGPRWASADDWAALLACGVIAFNGVRLIQEAGAELLDTAAADHLLDDVRTLARSVAGVIDVEKCHARKYGLSHVVDMHVIVDGNLSVFEGHRIAHDVRDAVEQSSLPVHQVLVHIEPAEEEEV